MYTKTNTSTAQNTQPILVHRCRKEYVLNTFYCLGPTQEPRFTHYEEQDHDEWKENWSSDIYSSSGSNKSRCVTFLINENLDYTFKDYTENALKMFKRIETPTKYYMGTFNKIN